MGTSGLLSMVAASAKRGEEVFAIATWAGGSATAFILSSREHPEQNIKHEFSKRRE
jgi:hypothetical protein